MKITSKLLATFALPLLAAWSVGPVSAQTSIGKTLLDKLNARVHKVESACAEDITKYCSTVTPGEGRMVYCMQAHEDKISPNCAFELEDAATAIQAAAEALKDGLIACKAEVNGVCGKIKPGDGRIATCLLENKSTASTGCAEAIAKVQSLASEKDNRCDGHGAMSHSQFLLSGVKRKFDLRAVRSAFDPGRVKTFFLPQKLSRAANACNDPTAATVTARSELAVVGCSAVNLPKTSNAGSRLANSRSRPRPC